VGLVVGKWHRGGNFQGATNFFRTSYDIGMTSEEKKRELWDRLENEPESAYRAFETYRNLPSGERTLIAAYRQHVGYPSATKSSDTWSRWFNQFGWRERAKAHDAHLDRIRERSIEKAIEEEAERQARETERARYRYNELLTRNYEVAIEYIESGDFLSQMRPQDVINIVKLHFEVVEKLGGFNPPQEIADWSEDEQAEFDRIVEQIGAEQAQEASEEESDEGECSTDDEPED
jgi:hypothetical protein